MLKKTGFSGIHFCGMCISLFESRVGLLTLKMKNLEDALFMISKYTCKSSYG